MLSPPDGIHGVILGETSASYAILSSIFRGAGDAAIAMRVLWLANGINIVLGPLLIFGVGPLPELGVTGAAVATTIGRGTGAAFALYRLFQPGRHIQVKREHLHIDIALMARASASNTRRCVYWNRYWIGVSILASSSAALAGYNIAIRIILSRSSRRWIGQRKPRPWWDKVWARKNERGAGV